MNILFYTKRGFNPKSGGIERVSDMLAKEFSKKANGVFYVTCFEEADYEKFTPEHVQLILPDSKNVCSTLNIEVFAQFVVIHQIDVIVCQYSFELEIAELPYLVKKQTGVKLLYAFHSSPNFPTLALRDLSYPVLPSEKLPHKQFKRITRILLKNQKQQSRDKKSGALFKSLYNMGDGLILLSAKYIPVVQQIAEISSADKFFAIANPNTYAENEINVAKKENSILFVGRLSVEKRPEKAMLLWQRIQFAFPDWNFKILGVGRLDNDVKKLHKKLKLDRCYLEGRQDPQPYYAKAKIILMTSDYEGFPLALTEAMQHSVMPVAFNHFEALTDVIVHNVNGIIAQPLDMADFESKLIHIMKHSETLQTMAENAKNTVKKFDIQNIVREWECVFRQIGC